MTSPEQGSGREPTQLTFRRIGRTHHLEIESADDLRGVLELDEALWVATSAPVDGLHCDPVFLKLVDYDRDERIRSYEVRLAVRWLLEHLLDTDEIAPGNVSLPLAAVNPETDEGRRMRGSVAKMLRSLGAGDNDRLHLDQVRAVRKAEESRAVSEAGVVLPEAAKGEPVRQLLQEILDTVGGEPHPSGRSGVTKAELEEFLSEAEAYVAWRSRAEPTGGQTESDVLPLGEATFGAWRLFLAVRDKVDQYFALDRATRFDPRFEGRGKVRDADLGRADLSSAEAVDALLDLSSLAEPRGDSELEIEGPVNPLYGEKLTALRDQVLRPILGKRIKKLSKSDWEKVGEILAPHGAWLAKKPEGKVGKLPFERLRRLLDGHPDVAAVRTLVHESEEMALVLENVRLVEKLILYKAYLLTFLNSYVSFPDLYDPASRALFEVGSLVMDGRHFNLAIEVPDRKYHSQVSGQGNMFVLYVAISTKQDPKPMEVAIPVTSGGRGNLYVGKRGVFDHVNGLQLDAVVVDIVENPISLSEAIAAPFKRLGRALTGKIEKLTATAEQKLDASSAETLDQVATALKEPSAAAPAAAPVGNVLAGGGIAVAALGSSAAFVTKTLAALRWQEILGSIAIAVLGVMLPVTISAYLKLRQRDLSTLLEGSGWGINTRMRLTPAQIRYFTHAPSFPAGARGVRHRSLRWWLWLAVLAALVAAAWYYWGRTSAG